MKKKFSLSKQLIIITIVAILFSFISTVVILPNILTPFYEKNIYQLLEQPLRYIKSEKDHSYGQISYIIYENGTLKVSQNFYELVPIKDANLFMSKITKSVGKIKINEKTYYYKAISNGSSKIITMTDDTYIKEQRTSFNSLMIPAMIITIVLIIGLESIYSNYLLKKISILKNKVDNIDNDKYNHNISFKVDDEFNSLLNSIEKTRVSLQEKEEYKNNMFQSISHELKTPIMVITSHIEAANDKIIKKDKALDIISEEAKNLENKVSLMLQINKLNYLKNNEEYKKQNTDLKPIINKAIDKFKIARPDVEFIFNAKGNTSFIGNEENWIIVIDNLLSNFIRYADKIIKIDIVDNNLSLFNDGPNIDKKLINEIFEPYKTGKKGKSGLGLTIVKQTLDLFGYKIVAINETNGMLFEIKKD